MGYPKLLVNLGGQTLLAHVVNALREGGCVRIAVVVPPADATEGPAVAAAASRAGALVVVPESRPAEMRDSVELGLAMLARGTIPDRIVIAPADSPGISTLVVAELLAEAARQPDRIVLPWYDGRRGHPIVLPWSMAGELAALPAGLGLNELVKRQASHVVEVPVAGPDLLADLDTPEDLRRWQASDRAAAPLTETPVRLRIRLFAAAKERAGRTEIELDLPAGSNVADLRSALGARAPELAPLVPTALIAIDEEYAPDEALVRPHARIAFIPPVSGGGGAPTKHAAAGQPCTRLFP
jgi:molybdenum cofactor cytidylyltransferase